MKTIQWLASALLVSAMAMPCAMAQGFYESNGAANLPSQRIVNEAPEGTGAVPTLSPATVRRVQQELNRLGCNAGPVSGSWDRMTSIAVADFQRAHGLSPVGTLDEATMRTLGVGIGGGQVAGVGGYPGMNGAYEGANGGYGAGMERGYGMNAATGAGEASGGYDNGAGMNGAYDGNRVNANSNAPRIGLSAGNISGRNDRGSGAFGTGGGVNGNSAVIVNGGSGSTGALNAGSGAGTLSGAAGAATTGAAPVRRSAAVIAAPKQS